MLSHKNLRNHQHYTKVLDRKVSEDMMALREKINYISIGKAKVING